MEGVRQVPALFKSNVGTEDSISIQIIRTQKEGWMVKSDFENLMGKGTVKVFPTKNSAVASANGEEIIAVNVDWKM
jgi:hypothetical protein